MQHDNFSQVFLNHFGILFQNTFPLRVQGCSASLAHYQALQIFMHQAEVEVTTLLLHSPHYTLNWLKLVTKAFITISAPWLRMA
jgi:hypothetical protein